MRQNIISIMAILVINIAVVTLYLNFFKSSASQPKSVVLIDERQTPREVYEKKIDSAIRKADYYLKKRKYDESQHQQIRAVLQELYDIDDLSKTQNFSLESVIGEMDELKRLAIPILETQVIESSTPPATPEETHKGDLKLLQTEASTYLARARFDAATHTRLAARAAELFKVKGLSDQQNAGLRKLIKALDDFKKNASKASPGATRPTSGPSASSLLIKDIQAYLDGKAFAESTHNSLEQRGLNLLGMPATSDADKKNVEAELQKMRKLKDASAQLKAKDEEKQPAITTEKPGSMTGGKENATPAENKPHTETRSATSAENTDTKPESRGDATQAKASGKLTIHKWRKDDSINKVAVEYQVTPEEIMSLNKKTVKNWNRVREEHEIIVVDNRKKD